MRARAPESGIVTLNAIVIVAGALVRLVGVKRRTAQAHAWAV